MGIIRLEVGLIVFPCAEVADVLLKVMINLLEPVALIDNREDIVGWTIVQVFEDGRIEPIDKDLQFNTIKDLIEAYL